MTYSSSLHRAGRLSRRRAWPEWQRASGARSQRPVPAAGWRRPSRPHLCISPGAGVAGCCCRCVRRNAARCAHGRTAGLHVGGQRFTVDGPQCPAQRAHARPGVVGAPAGGRGFGVGWAFAEEAARSGCLRVSRRWGSSSRRPRLTIERRWWTCCWVLVPGVFASLAWPAAVSCCASSLCSCLSRPVWASVADAFAPCGAAPFGCFLGN
jgi:hypothetical protein